MINIQYNIISILIINYYCLWCYYHVSIIVCDVIIMSVLLFVML